MPRREKPAIVGVGRMPGAAARQAHGPVERSTLIRSGMKMPAMSVRLVSGAGPLPPKTIALIKRREFRVQRVFANSSLSRVGLVRL